MVRRSLNYDDRVLPKSQNIKTRKMAYKLQENTALEDLNAQRTLEDENSQPLQQTHHQKSQPRALSSNRSSKIMLVDYNK